MAKHGQATGESVGGQAKASAGKTKAQPQIRRRGWSNYFGLKAQGTDIRTEFIAGVTTFLTMVYIVFVNPIDPRQGRHGPGRGVRRHLHRRRGEHLRDGVLRQLSDRAGARHGHQRLLRLHRGADLQIHLAAGAGRGVLLRRAVLPDLGIPHPAICDRRHSAEPEARGVGRRRAVPRHHRAGGVQGHRRPSGDAGDARRPDQTRCRS